MMEAMKMRAELLLLLALSAVPAAARSRAPRALPAAEELILKAFSPPQASYRARERVQVFAEGRKPRGRTFLRTAASDGRMRLETLPGPKSAKASVVFIRGGGTASLSWPARKRFWTGPSSAETSQEMLERLKAFYSLSVSTGGRVAKRATWRVDLRLPGGRLRRSLWVDRLGGLLLKRETYRNDGSLIRRERVMKIETSLQTSESDFSLKVPEGSVSTDWSAPLTASSASSSPLVPGWIPDGFLPTSLHSYGDGASVFTLAEAASSPSEAETRGVKTRRVRLKSGEFSVSNEGETLRLEHRGRARSLTASSSGALSEDDLARILESVRESR